MRAVTSLPTPPPYYFSMQMYVAPSASFLRQQADAAEYRALEEANEIAARKAHEREMMRKSLLQEEADIAARIEAAKNSGKSDAFTEAMEKASDDKRQMKIRAALILLLIVVVVSVCSSGNTCTVR